MSVARKTFDLAPLRAAIEANWGPASRCNRSANAAILQLAAGMVDEADGMVGHRTLHQVRDLLDGGWSRAPGFVPPVTNPRLRPEALREALEATYCALRALLGPDRDLYLALVQAMLGLDPTGLLGDSTKGAVDRFLDRYWIYSGPVPARR